MPRKRENIGKSVLEIKPPKQRPLTDIERLAELKRRMEEERAKKMEKKLEEEKGVKLPKPAIPGESPGGEKPAEPKRGWFGELLPPLEKETEKEVEAKELPDTRLKKKRK